MRKRLSNPNDQKKSFRPLLLYIAQHLNVAIWNPSNDYRYTYHELGEDRRNEIPPMNVSLPVSCLHHHQQAYAIAQDHLL